MNVTVYVALALTGALDGRRKVELGLPPTADLGDVLQTLITLYPKLGVHLPHEGPTQKLQMSVLYQPRSEAWPLRLREGQTVYLVADQPRRLTDAAD